MRYVGQTQLGVRARLAQHLAEANRSDFRVSRWIRKTRINGFQVLITALEENAVVNESEIKWIAFYRASHSDLTNTATGGKGGLAGVPKSEATRARMRKPKTLATKMKMRKPKSDETKRRMSLAQVGNSKSQGERNRHAKLNLESVRDVKRMLGDGMGVSEVARIYGLQKAAISKINTGRNWSFVV